jgi:AraC family transcriptional regulator
MAAAQKALWYIETHFSGALALNDVAVAAGVSPFHLTRVFQAATGWPVVRYLRARRLSEAARVLAGGAPDILEVALSAGYGSHEAFTRAFREQFGRTPEDVRQGGSVEGLAVVEAMRVMQEPVPEAQVPRVEEAGPLLIAGLGARYLASNSAAIPSQWQRYEHDARSRPKGKYAYGVCFNYDDEGNFDYLCGHEVQNFTSVPAEFTRLRLARQPYAVVRHTGHIGSIPLTWRAFLETWLPASGLMAADAPDFERYDADFDPLTGMGGVEIWVPLVP